MHPLFTYFLDGYEGLLLPCLVFWSFMAGSWHAQGEPIIRRRDGWLGLVILAVVSFIEVVVSREYGFMIAVFGISVAASLLGNVLRRRSG